jgi:hypothetical protein
VFPDDEVPVARLDAISPAMSALIKIDVEGMEPDVLPGPRETIELNHPVLYVEAQMRRRHEGRNSRRSPGYVHTKTFGSTPLEEWEWQR